MIRRHRAPAQAGAQAGRRWRTWAPACAGALLAACSFEPRYATPDLPVPPSWPAGDAYLLRSEQGLATVTYRDIFRDPRLQAVIARALANNQDLATAVANVRIARGQYRVQRSDLLPGIDGTARATFQDNGNGGFTTVTPGTGTGPGGTGTGGTGGTGTGTGGTGGGQVAVGGGGASQIYSVNLGTTAFEIDLFGRVRSLSRAALNDYFATEAAVRAARLTIVADTASAWLTLATDRSLLAIANDTATSARESVRLTQARLDGGIAPRTDLRQAQTILDQALADLADLTAQVAQDRNALELLVGASVPDAELPPSIEAVDGTLGELPAGLSSDILLRRPDVVQAEYTLKASNANIGAARAAFFPRISLTGIVGFASTALSSLFSGGSFNWSVAPSASLPIFDGGANRGNLEVARGQYDRALAEYRQTVQTAFREVSDALARRGVIGNQFAAQADLAAAAQDTLDLQTARYREGIDPYLNTLDAQRTFYTARRALAQVRLVRASNLVQLYSSLGGDQRIDELPPPRTVR